MAAEIVLFCERRKWHGRSISRAFRARGIRPLAVSLASCGFSTETKTGLAIPGLGDHLPKGALVLFVPGGSFEQVTTYLGVLHALRELGVTVWNDARAIERCVDKSTATFLFQKAGLATPPTRVVETHARAHAHLTADPRPFVLKPLFGSQGNGVRRAHNADELPAPEEVGDVYYMQHYLRAPEATLFEDWRVFVSNGRLLSAMVRRGKSWITNVHQGAEPIAHDPCEEMSRLALAAVAAIGADYAGVDLIRDASGRLMVLEINSNPAWKGLQSVTATDIADTLAADFLAAVTQLPALA